MRFSWPLQFARLKGVSVGSFTLNVKIRREHGSMIVVFGYVDTLHFYYAHLSKDPGAKVAVHNGIFIVERKSRPVFNTFTFGRLFGGAPSK